MFRSTLFAAATLLGTLSATAPARSEVLLIERTQKAAASTTPRRGATMTQVSAEFGEPSKRHSAVGKPPITRWDYPGFSVYFEHKHVINSVLTKSSELETGVKPAQ